MGLPSNYRVVVARILNLRFENDVVSNGSQTELLEMSLPYVFENDVVSNGSQTRIAVVNDGIVFENDVVSNGSQTQVVRLMIGT